MCVRPAATFYPADSCILKAGKAFQLPEILGISQSVEDFLKYHLQDSNTSILLTTYL